MWERSCRLRLYNLAKERLQVPQTYGRGLSALVLAVIVDAELLAVEGVLPTAALNEGGLDMMVEEHGTPTPESFIHCGRCCKLARVHLGVGRVEGSVPSSVMSDSSEAGGENNGLICG